MFPRETEAFYLKKSPAAAPAPKPVVVATPVPNAAPPARAAVNGHAIRRFFITINSRRSEVLVEEIS